MTRTPSARSRAARPGFTLVELLVAAAVCIIIMAILATCFQSGIDTLRQLRSQGDMTDQLRAAEVVIKKDLQAKRFPPDDTRENQGVRLSDLRYDQLTISGTTVVRNSSYNYSTNPPAGGFMRIRSTPAVDEWHDADSIVSTRAIDHYLHFTSILPGGTDQNIYTATVNGITYTSPAAEIAYFLDTSVPTGSTGGVPTFNLVRRQRLVAVNSTDRANYPNTDPGVISISPVANTVNTLSDLTNPNNRLTGPAGGVATCNPVGVGNDFFLAPISGVNPAGSRLGDDVLLSNVISFEVKVNWEPAKYGIPAVGFNPAVPNPPIPLPPWIAPRAARGTPMPNNDNDNDGQPDDIAYNGSGNSDYPFDTLPGRVAANSPFPNNGRTPDNWTSRFNALLNAQPGGSNVFDTWTTALPNWASAMPHPDAIPMRARVKAVQIRIRIYDPKLKNARQLSIVQDL